MLLLASNNTDPFFNIATEEYLLKESDEEIFMLYINGPSVIVGKHQNTLAEVNLRFAVKNNIPIIRRFSGGGTVYHDLGNLNFTFFNSGNQGQLINFRKYTQLIIDVLNDLNVDALFEGKNDIRVNGLKISGNAAHVYKNRVMHHGTILVSSDLKKLSTVLNVEPGKYSDKAVKSIHSLVANLNSFFKTPLSISELQKLLFDRIKKTDVCSNYILSENDINNIENLIGKKYSTWDWNFGYSPDYEFRNIAIIEGRKTTIFLQVEKGIIVDARINKFENLQKLFHNVRHDHDEIVKIIQISEGWETEKIKEIAWNFL